ncbi:MAG: glycerol-3-phosphate dehydrogenase/oxidase [Bryobacterales bacterium]|nr:glycerol-3-phosphate dehydrogenase/oxidase [Bryobacterales bacterium]
MPSAFPPDHRAHSIDRLRTQPFDILIVGGGINGAGIARDLSLRSRDTGQPLNIGLIEKSHFSSGTSGRNSQLIHGGLRYLKYFEFHLVEEALHERATLVKIAPHLVEPLPLILPFYGGPLKGLWNRLFYGTGLWLYDQLAGSVNIGRRRYLSAHAAHQLEPGLAQQGLHSAAIFYDCRVHSARLLLETLFDAATCGAAIANYVTAAEWSRDGGTFLVQASDTLTGEQFTIRAKRLVDARGPWDTSGNVRLVRGSHIIVPRVNQSENAIAYFGPDGRIVFVIPWGHDLSLSLVGTTDIDHKGTPDDVRISPEEVRYLRDTLRRLFPQTGAEPVAAYSSLRPLVAGGTGSATAASRSHKIWIENGILKIAGGKYTTYRSMSEEAVDLLEPRWKGQCRTAQVPLGGDHPRVLTEPDPATIDWAIDREMARSLPDVIYISTYWGHEHLLTASLLRPIAEQMAARLNWTPAQTQSEIARTLQIAQIPRIP